MVDIIDLKKKSTKITEQWHPGIIGKLNDYHLKLAKLQGEFVWHSHPETDELFLVVDGAMGIEFRDHSITLISGQACVVPAGMEHKPFAERECTVMLIEPAGTINTGDAGGDFTVEELEWL